VISAKYLPKKGLGRYWIEVQQREPRIVLKITEISVVGGKVRKALRHVALQSADFCQDGTNEPEASEKDHGLYLKSVV
jgi:hypothetical protein